MLLTSTPRWIALASLLLLSLLGRPASAQDPVDAPETAVEAGAEATGFEDPRAAYAAYLGFMRDHRADRAVESGLFDALGADAEERALKAKHLYEVLLRIEPIELRDVTDSPVASTVTWPIAIDRRRTPIVDAHGRLTFTRNGEGGWRFAAATGDWIDRAYRALADEPLRETALAALSPLERLRLKLRGSLPESLRARAFVLENWQWIAIGVVLAISVLLGKIAQIVLGAFAKRAAGREGVLGIASELKRFNRPIGLLTSATLFGVLLPLAGLEDQILAAVAFATRFVGTFAGLWAAYRAVDLGCGILEERAKRSANRFDDILVPLLRTTLHVFVVVVGIVYLAAEWTDQVWSVVAGLSIGSLAIGFAARDSIENLFGTFTVLVDKPFALGDWIVVKGIEGTVEAVGFRSTRIRTFYDSVQSVPNRTFISSEVENYGHRRKRRIKTTLRLALDTPADTVDAFCAGVRQLIANHPASVPSNYVYLYDLGQDAIEVLLYSFVRTPDWDMEMREKHRLLGDVLRLAERLGIRLAAPARSIQMQDAPEREPAATGEGSEDLGKRLADEICADAT